MSNQSNDLKTTNTDMGFGALENKQKIQDIIEEEPIIEEVENEESDK